MADCGLTKPFGGDLQEFVVRDCQLNRMESGATVSDLDKLYFQALRANVARFMKNCASLYGDVVGAKLLDIAPQDHAGARPFFKGTVKVETLDINPESKANIIGDITKTNNAVPSGRYIVLQCFPVPQPIDQRVCRIIRLCRMYRSSRAHIAAFLCF